MSDINYEVTVAKDLEDLIPVFLKNRHKELETLRTALEANDYEQLRQLGHRMKGVGNSYGFEHVSTLGKRIEDSARSSDSRSIGECVSEYTEYLRNIHIVYE